MGRGGAGESLAEQDAYRTEQAVGLGWVILNRKAVHPIADSNTHGLGGGSGLSGRLGGVRRNALSWV